MANTKEGGRKARATNIERYGKDYYRKIGSLGGRKGHTGGFAANPALARVAGAIGGRKSKRTSGPAKQKEYYYTPTDGKSFVERYAEMTVGEARELNEKAKENERA